MKRWASLSCLVLGICLCAAGLRGGDLTGGPYAIGPLDVNCGGTRSTGGVYTLNASTAQTGGVGVITGGVYRLNDGFWPAAVKIISLVDPKPPDQGSLWRSRKNVIRLTFDGDVTAPAPGEILIQEMLAGGNYGADLSSEFTFTVENDGAGNPCILKIQENASALGHRKWYAVRNVGNWSEVADFTLQYVVQVGDANGDGQVLNADIGVINAAVPSFGVGDDDPRDIDGNGHILNRDVGIANQYVPSLPVTKPSGH